MIETMKAAICSAYGEPEVVAVTDVPKPHPKKNELLIRINASAMNSGDVRVRGLDVDSWMKPIMRMVLGLRKPRNPILGTVLSGVVDELGEGVGGFSVGDRVIALTGFRFGAHAQFTSLNHKYPILKIPDRLDMESAVALLFGGSSAYFFLHRAGIADKPHPKVCIYGGTGSVGVAAIQIALYYGAELTVISGSQGFDLVKSLGVKHVLDYEGNGMYDLNDTFDIVFDAVGKMNKSICKKILRDGGVFQTVGGMVTADETVEQLEFLVKLYSEGFMKPVIDRTYSLDEIREAHRYVDLGHKKGNVVICIH